MSYFISTYEELKLLLKILNRSTLSYPPTIATPFNKPTFSISPTKPNKKGGSDYVLIFRILAELNTS